MTFQALWASYIFIIGGLGGLSKLLSSALNDDAQRELSLWLKKRVAREPASWIQAANHAFLSAFDWLFASKKTPFEGCLWLALLLSPLLLILARLAFLVGGVDTGDATNLLAFALGLASALAIFLSGTRAKTGPGCVVSLLAFVLVVMLGRLVLGTLGNLLVGLGLGLFSGTLVGAVLSRSFIGGLGFPLTVACGLFVILLGILALALEAVTSFGSYTFGFAAIGFGIGAEITALAMLGPGPIAPASPLRTFVYSLFFIALVSLLRLDAARSFVDALYAGGPRLLLFVAYTVFADGFSLLETQWILRRATGAGTARMLALLVVDLILSAAIFLFLPLVLGEIPSFVEGALFRGDRPWLGILFWSSFSTSATFYVFVTSSLLIRPLAHMPKLARYLAIETRPVLILTIAVGAAITLIYILGAGVAVVLWFVRASSAAAG